MCSNIELKPKLDSCSMEIVSQEVNYLNSVSRQIIERQIESNSVIVIGHNSAFFYRSAAFVMQTSREINSVVDDKEKKQLFNIKGLKPIGFLKEPKKNFINKFNKNQHRK